MNVQRGRVCVIGDRESTGYFYRLSTGFVVDVIPGDLENHNVPLTIAT
jgi:hypothetical protein